MHQEQHLLLAQISGMNHFGIPLKPPRWSSLIQSVPWSGAHLVELVFDWAELHQNELRDNWRSAEEHMILQDIARGPIAVRKRAA